MSANNSTDVLSAKRRVSWIDVADGCDFTIDNIPFGVYRPLRGTPRCCTAIGDYILDLSLLADNSYFQDVAGLDKNVFRHDALNNFIALGKPCTVAVRDRIIDLLSIENKELQGRRDVLAHVLVPMQSVTMQMPVTVGDYTDFYSSREHATNIGSLVRDPQNPLLPNWMHLPVAYHGRASSIVPSGTSVIRPCGQFKKNPADTAPVFGPTERLDYELELAFVIGKNSPIGQPISVDDATEFIFGFLLFNDWSARDIQSWEYAPLGPFLSKNFMSSVSPWIVTAEALAPFRVPGPEPQVQLLPYLQSDGDHNYDIDLEVYLAPEGGAAQRISTTNFKYMYWNTAQQLAHHTVTGCNVKVGDLMASGTISGPGHNAQGCLMELSKNGQSPLAMRDGSVRSFLHDGDTVIMKAYAQKNGMRVGFGELVGKVVAAH